jgi:hypothetical protein
LRQGALSALFKAHGVYSHWPLRPQQHLTCLQHDTVLATQRLPSVVGRLAQIRRTGLRFKLWPQRVNHLVASQTLVWLQAQQLHKLCGTQAGPALCCQFDSVDGNRKSTKQGGFQA